MEDGCSASESETVEICNIIWSSHTQIQINLHNILPYLSDVTHVQCYLL